MIAVADTSPINYLILVGEINVLPALHNRVIVPGAVHEELTRKEAPVPVKSWIAALPEWMEVRSVAVRPDDSLHGLDVGEREAILLAQELRADRLLLEEAPARLEAQRRRLPVMGTLGVLGAGAKVGIVSFEQAIVRLRETTFYISDQLINRLRDELSGIKAAQHL
jgi:predicted nucleic acid-binding protein